MLVIGILLHLKNKTANDVKIPLIIYLTVLTHIVIGVGLIYLLIEIKNFYKEN